MTIASFINRLLRRKPNHFYVSPMDQFLTDFDQKHPQKSRSQRKEIDKYARINELRDNPVAEVKDEII